MSHFDAPSRLLCLHCATLLSREEIADGACPVCGTAIDVGELEKLYEFAAETYYYGHQYRVVYEEQFKQTEHRVRYSLEFAGEAFAWVMLAVASGVLGNAAYDGLKLVVERIRADVAAGKLSDRDYGPLLALSDEELGSILYSAKQYLTGMDGLTKEVRLAIAEEIAADAIAHDPKLGEEMLKLMNKKTVKPKDRQRFAQLLRHAIVRQKKSTTPNPRKLENLWGKVGDK
jgi:Zn-finger nucleic acid-binding protein